jgi:hypothetical protein
MKTVAQAESRVPGVVILAVVPARSFRSTRLIHFPNMYKEALLLKCAHIALSKQLLPEATWMQTQTMITCRLLISVQVALEEYEMEQVGGADREHA